MGIIKKIQNVVKNRSIIDSSVADYNKNNLKLDSLNDFGVTVTNTRAMKLTAMFDGIRIRSENIASFPKVVQKKTVNGPTDASDHPANRLISIRPNAYTSPFDFWFCINAALDGWGNAFAIIKRNNAGEPISIHQVHPSFVRIKMVDGMKYYRVDMCDSNFNFLNGIYSDEDMLHFMLVTFDGISGVNPVVYNAMALGKGLAVQKFAAEYFSKGGEIKAVLETDKSLGDSEYDAFLNKYQQSAQNFETPLLEYGIKYKQIGVSPVAAQLIQSETFSILDICRILNIPPHMLAELSHATFTNIEHQTIQFVVYALRPTVKRLEVELERKLFFDSERGEYSIKFILEGLLRGDSAARAAFYHNSILDGWMSRNEVRRKEGLKDVDGLDNMLYPLNTGIVGNQENN